MLIELSIIFLFLFASCLSDDSDGDAMNCNQIVFTYTNSNGNTNKFYGYTDIDSALTCSKRLNKKLLIIFKAEKAVACHNLEWRMLSLFDNMDYLRQKYVIAYLSVDDSRPLSKTYKVNHAFYGGDYFIDTKGKENAYLQLKITNSNVEPLLCISDTNFKPLGSCLQFTRSKEEVENFIFRKQKSKY